MTIVSETTRKAKRWRVDVYFVSPLIHEPTLIKTREFRFHFMAMLYARENEIWCSWKSTRPIIVDQHLSQPTEPLPT